MAELFLFPTQPTTIIPKPTIKTNKPPINSVGRTATNKEKNQVTTFSLPDLQDLAGLNASKKKKETKKKTKKTTTTDQTAEQGQKIAFSDNYKYNAPMVKEAYFGAPSFENTILEGNLVDQGNYADARQAWKGTTGGRGTIQMDEKFLNSYSSSLQGKAPKNFDGQKYGFKFLYNPQTVGMAWGMLMEMDPTFEAMAKDKFQVVSTALMTSTISFELLLNRIKDFDYVTENGIRPKSNKNVPVRQLENTVQDRNPYPLFVSTDDAKEIYRKGTMYDIEYFLKTINGPNATFTSDLNGVTADYAWLRPTIVELHLGDAMRYRVRISDFSVNHIIFNSRMVPMLSSVRLTCHRFIDGPQVDKVLNVKGQFSSSPGTSDLRDAGYTTGQTP